MEWRAMDWEDMKVNGMDWMWWDGVWGGMDCGVRGKMGWDWEWMNQMAWHGPEWCEVGCGVG